MPIDPSKIAKAIRAAQAAKKKVAKIPAGQASKVAREQVRGSGNTSRKINKAIRRKRKQLKFQIIKKMKVSWLVIQFTFCLNTYLEMKINFKNH